MSVIVDDLNFKTESALDMKIAPHFRLWVLLAMIFGILLLMTVVICCFAKIRIPRTKREIELNAASRKLLSGSRKFSCLPCAFTNRKHSKVSYLLCSSALSSQISC
ncbi:unnamed protein product [Soboliphyme baturini]|uniref:Transmembrane protein 167A n=1 Tax=Soboliphyme baturini TaxID=241478 RepID=A0A183I938_9BILA|nr:unnamed protein product [Soboliphyme baturini]